MKGEKKAFLDTILPQNTPKTLPKSKDNVKTRVFDAQDHEDFIFDGPRPLILTVLAQNEYLWDTN